MVAARKPWDEPGLKPFQKYEFLTNIYLYKCSKWSRKKSFSVKNVVQYLCKNINPGRSMVAARKPWDVPGLKQYKNVIQYLCKNINPGRSMVAARKPWDVPGLKQYQLGNNPEGVKPKIQNVSW